MCTVYAFMRRADDLADDESLPVAERRVRLAAWQQAWHSRSAEATVDAPVFLALQDVQRRYGISDALLDDLVSGTAMDLEQAPPVGVVKIDVGDGRQFDAYQTQSALEAYCYLVASVVGLATIRIFGYSDAAAEPLAVELGQAFQLTNILRDVQEDAERGRIYLPLDLLEQHGASAHDLLAASKGHPISSTLRASMRALATDAERRYAAADALIPMLHADSRPAMRVLVGIYHELLQRIIAADFEVFSQRIRVSTGRKLSMLVRGVAAARFASVLQPS